MVIEVNDKADRNKYHQNINSAEDEKLLFHY